MAIHAPQKRALAMCVRLDRLRGVVIRRRIARLPCCASITNVWNVGPPPIVTTAARVRPTYVAKTANASTYRSFAMIKRSARPTVATRQLAVSSPQSAVLTTICVHPTVVIPLLVVSIHRPTATMAMYALRIHVTLRLVVSTPRKRVLTTIFARRTRATHNSTASFPR